MANPGKTYNLPCTYTWYFGSAGNYVYITDYLKIGGREYTIFNTMVDDEEIS